ncbi:MAG TPA: YceI family protein [Flavobacterium sp.]|nr:YceI family protein [Flavobacterium sp.]
MKKWNVDPSHTEIGFRVKHMMFTNVKGQFKEYNADIALDDSLQNASFEFNANVNSIDTNNNDRDNHLRSADFFNVEEFPLLKFKSTEVKNNGSDYEIKGDLTIKDVTRPVALKGSISGLMKDPWGNNRVGLTLEGAINRKDFGLTYNAALETGGVLVGEEVKLNVELQLLENN